MEDCSVSPNNGVRLMSGSKVRIMLTEFKSRVKGNYTGLRKQKSHRLRDLSGFKTLLAALIWALAAPALAAAPALPSKNGIPTLAPILEQVTPAVVNIAVLSRSPVEENPLFRDPFFRRFFDLPERAEPRVSAGSGVIVDAAKGLVLTNNHVIKDANEILVTLKDRRQFEAKLIGSDPGTDIALLKIEPQSLSALKIGDSDNLEVGDFVVAIGNPFGLGQTVTSGIVSALGRTGLNIEGYEDFIQTDASINPGNSGGALVSLTGELIGINTAIIGPAGGNVGIGFAVPSNMARAVMSQLLRFGEVKRGRLGVDSQDLTPDLAKALGVSSSAGAVVTQVEPDSPAEKAGLKARDVITALNGKPVRSSADVRNRVGLVPIGEEVELKIMRDGTAKTVRAKVEKPFELSDIPGESIPQLAGAALSNVTRAMPIYGRIEGVVVVGMQQGSLAWRYGLRPGDVIIGVNRRKVQNLKELTPALKQAQSQGSTALTVLRGDFRLVIVIR